MAQGRGLLRYARNDGNREDFGGGDLRQIQLSQRHDCFGRLCLNIIGILALNFHQILLRLRQFCSGDEVFEILLRLAREPVCFGAKV